jgi:hypothetical protein
VFRSAGWASPAVAQKLEEDVEVLKQGGKPLLAYLLAAGTLKFSDDLAGSCHLRHAPVRWFDERCTPVVRVGRALQVAKPLEIVDQGSHGLWRHTRRLSEVCEPHALLFDVLKNLRVGGS